MTVTQFDPKQTTTLETPKKVIEEQSVIFTSNASQGEQSSNRAAKIGFVSLGCPKNLVDSERILTQLRTEGYDLTNSYDDA